MWQIKDQNASVYNIFNNKIFLSELICCTYLTLPFHLKFTSVYLCLTTIESLLSLLCKFSARKDRVLIFHYFSGELSNCVGKVSIKIKIKQEKYKGKGDCTDIIGKDNVSYERKKESLGQVSWSIFFLWTKELCDYKTKGQHFNQEFTIQTVFGSLCNQSL